MKSMTANFDAMLRTEVLKVLHNAINTLYDDCTRYDLQVHEEAFKRKVGALKNAVNTFIDGEAEVYEELIHSSTR